MSSALCVPARKNDKARPKAAQTPARNHRWPSTSSRAKPKPFAGWRIVLASHTCQNQTRIDRSTRIPTGWLFFPRSAVTPSPGWANRIRAVRASSIGPRSKRDPSWRPTVLLLRAFQRGCQVRRQTRGPPKDPDRVSPRNRPKADPASALGLHKSGRRLHMVLRLSGPPRIPNRRQNPGDFRCNGFGPDRRFSGRRVISNTLPVVAWII